MIDLPRHFEASAPTAGSAEGIRVIADEPDLLAKHMCCPSFMKGGGSIHAASML
ncbi:hypothetical protein K7W03_03630 [Sphingobium sp. PNB]|uniref:hypothetical protein n=1 Tax=Sphingobium sp. PNB TaxID=863934 RepID=UPI001CA3FB1A|nr:hypothetical protein [Sphingobium sp. PNB]MCB4858681.1 hypothetical protein [Sphingobium sp. PNB]